MDLAFRALQEDFTGVWPAALHIENPEYTATLFYAGAGTDPSSDIGEYAADLAAGRLDRKNLSLACKPKDRRRETNLDIIQGRVVLKPMPITPSLTSDEARRGLSLLLALSLLMLILAGCGGQEADTTADQSGQPQTEEPAGASQEPEPEPDPVELALEQYRTIVGQADTYDYTSADEPTGAYRYALVRMAPEDDVPSLLLEQDTALGISSVLVFRYDTDTKAVLQADGTLMEGVAGFGGYRGSLSAAGDGNGLLSTEFSSGSGEGSTSRVTLDGDKLQSEIIWEGYVFDDTDKTAEEIGFISIDWHDVSDASALDGWTPDAPQTVPAPAEPAKEPAVPVTDGDRIVFTGTLGAYSYNEVLALQGLDDPNPGSDRGETYWLIVLDTPQNMALRSYGGDSYEGEVSLVNVTGADGLEQYDGQRLTISIDADSTWWPSDTSLPLGQPSTSDVHILP